MSHLQVISSLLDGKNYYFEPANLFVMVLVKKELWTTCMGGFIPIWNKIQNLQTVSGSLRPWVVSVGSFRPAGSFWQMFFFDSALIGGSFRPEFLGGSFRQVYAGGR